MDEASRRRDGEVGRCGGGVRRRRWQIYFRDGPPLNFDGHSNDRALISGNKSRLYHPFTGTGLRLSWAAGTKKSKRDRPRREIPPGGSVTTRAIIGTSQPVFMMSDVNQCAGPGADEKAPKSSGTARSRRSRFVYDVGSGP